MKRPILLTTVLVCVGSMFSPPVAAQAAAPDAESVLESLGDYVGRWRAEDRTGPDGRVSHFEYELTWYDRSRTVIEMLITDVFDDGTVMTLWKGFKGKGPAGEGVFYHGFSPGGRTALGHVVREGDDLVTEYDGWGPDGNVVRVRDVFGSIAEGSFDARTFVRATPEAEWRNVMSDRWTRIAQPIGAEEGEELDLALPLRGLSALIGEWSGVASVGQTRLESTWRWQPVAVGSGVLMTVAESFNGGPWGDNMVELATWDASDERIRFSTVNGRGRFTMEGTIEIEASAVLRSWVLYAEDGSVTEGRDRLEIAGGWIEWTQSMNRGDGWEDAPYSPFRLKKVGEA